MKNLIGVFGIILLLASYGCEKSGANPSLNCYDCIIDSIHGSNVRQHHTLYRTICAESIDSIKNIHNSEVIVKFICKE